MANQPTPTPEKKPVAPEPRLVVTAWPHVRTPESVPRIMFSVVAALLPATLVGLYYFGSNAAWTLLWSVGAALGAEWLIQRAKGEKDTLGDGSAAVTGLLLGLTMPPSSPWWLSAIGGAFAIGIGKQVYGGLGHNIFNPALISRVFLLIAFPVEMTTWPVVAPPFPGLDVVTGATPLGQLQIGRLTGKGLGEAVDLSLGAAFVGSIGGSLGETSALALLIGAAFLLSKRIITWHISITMLFSAALFALVFWLIDPHRYASPLFHLLTGGMLIGAFFMATDMVTSPTTPRGQIVFGAGCGLLTMVIRTWGGYPEGVSFAIVIMNAFSPMIERYTRPRRYGEVRT
ncbi:MAG: RnfABCDGE type electron transport complex subunit D [Nitrospirae bacterium]|nr:RnfABCDGE type electron transport complex subunit D [Nitrospirota bacterium]